MKRRYFKLLFAFLAIIWIISFIFIFIPSSIKFRKTYPPMPTVPDVMKVVEGVDSLETWAKQAGAFEQLCNIQAVADGNPYNKLTSREERIQQSYFQKRDELMQKGKRNSPPKNGFGFSEWEKKYNYYSIAWSYRQELYTLFFDTKLEKRCESLYAKYLVGRVKPLKVLFFNVSKKYYIFLNWLLIISLFLVFFFLTFSGIKSDYRVDEYDPFIWYWNGKKYRIWYVTGSVITTNDMFETQLTATGSAESFNVVSKTIEHNRFSLRTAQGNEIPYRLINTELGLRIGSRLTVFYFNRRGFQSKEILFHNHDTGLQARYFNILKPIFLIRFLPILPLFLGLLFFIDLQIRNANSFQDFKLIDYWGWYICIPMIGIVIYIAIALLIRIFMLDKFRNENIINKLIRSVKHV